MVYGVEYPGGKCPLNCPFHTPISGYRSNDASPPKSTIIAKASIRSRPLQATPATVAGTSMLDCPWFGRYADVNGLSPFNAGSVPCRILYAETFAPTL